jgi:hypothetical protein
MSVISSVRLGRQFIRGDKYPSTRVFNFYDVTIVCTVSPKNCTCQKEPFFYYFLKKHPVLMIIDIKFVSLLKKYKWKSTKATLKQLG